MTKKNWSPGTKNEVKKQFLFNLILEFQETIMGKRRLNTWRIHPHKTPGWKKKTIYSIKKKKKFRSSKSFLPVDNSCCELDHPIISVELIVILDFLNDSKRY